MNCQKAKPLIEPYADGELDVSGILELEQHFKDCPACSLAWRNAQGIKKTLKQNAFFFTAPDSLRQSIQSKLHAQVEKDSPRTHSRWNWNWLTAATSSLATACVVVALTLRLALPNAQQQLAQEVVSSHVRSLMASHALDVVSTDQHTVKPWFNGKLDFAPPVKDLAAQEFPLIGGRLDYLRGHSVAALVYQRQKHFINLFIWPEAAAASEPAAAAPIQGYNLIHWSQAQMTFWAVSDLNEKELLEFARDYSASTTLR